MLQRLVSDGMHALASTLVAEDIYMQRYLISLLLASHQNKAAAELGERFSLPLDLIELSITGGSLKDGK